jgi:dipeptidyl aminopeptidase/acylaminoacyl peptidase
MANMDAERVGRLVENELAGRDAFAGLTGLLERAYLPEGRTSSDSFILYVPSTYDPRKPCPLVLGLHGYGGSTFLSPLSPVYMDFVSQCEAKGVILASPNGLHHLPGEPGGWISPASEADTMLVVSIVRAKYSIDPARIYLTGLSMGGYGAMHIAARHGDVFAAVASVAGGMPLSITDLSVFKDLPVFLAHGSADETVSVSESRDIHERLTMRGYECDYEEYPGLGHNAWDKAYSGGKLLDWFLARPKKGS